MGLAMYAPFVNEALCEFLKCTLILVQSKLYIFE